MDEIRLESYSKALVEEFADDADTIAVLNRLSRSEREEFELRIPEKATLLRMVKQEGWARRRKAREAEEQAKEAAYRHQVMQERAAGEPIMNFSEAIAKAASKLAIDLSAPKRKDEAGQ